MTFARVNSLGWALFEELTSAQMNTMDIDHIAAVDGAGGGSYNIAAPLAFFGSYFNIESIFSAPGAVMFNAVKYGADPTGAADSTAAIQAANDDAAAAGGHVLFMPGSYKHNDSLHPSPGVHWFGVPDVTFLLLNHATKDQFIWDNGSSRNGFTRHFGLGFGALVDNSGSCIFAPSGHSHRLKYTMCTFNDPGSGGSAKLKGKFALLQGDTGIYTFEHCDFNILSGMAGNGLLLSTFYGRLILERNRATWPVTYAHDFIDIDDGESEAYNNRFDMSLHNGTQNVFNYASSVHQVAKGNIFRGGASFNGSAFAGGGGNLVNETGSTFLAVSKPYSFGARLLFNSELTLSAHDTLVSSSNAPVCTDGFRAMTMKLSGTTPTITLPTILFAGQEFELSVYNVSGSTWAGPAFTVGSPGNVVPGGGSQANLKSRTFRFRALDVKCDGGIVWVQIGDASLGTSPYTVP